MMKLLLPAGAAGRTCAAMLLTLGLWAAATPAPAAEDAPMDPRAVEKLQRMSEVLAKAQTLRLEAKSLYDQVELSGVKIKRGVTHEVILKRPDSLYYRSVRDDGKVREGRYGGKALTIVPEGGGAYALIDAPGGVDTMLDLIQTDYQVNVPVVDLLYADLYGRAKDQLLSGAYLGERTVDGEVLDHLSFETTAVDWQLWLERGDRPLPRRLVITFVNAPGAPEYLTVINKWELDREVEGSLFRFDPPADWRRIDIAKVPAPQSRQAACEAKQQEYVERLKGRGMPSTEEHTYMSQIGGGMQRCMAGETAAWENIERRLPTKN